MHIKVGVGYWQLAFGFWLLNGKDCFRGPMFEELKEVENLKKFSLNRWTIEWANRADLAPEFLYDWAMQQDQDRSVKKV